MLATVDAGSSVAFNSREQTSGGTVGTYKGRKFVPTKDSKAAAAAAASAKMKIPKNVNLEDLHQAMEDDSTAVDVLKREVRPVCRKALITKTTHLFYHHMYTCKMTMSAVDSYIAVKASSYSCRVVPATKLVTGRAVSGFKLSLVVVSTFCRPKDASVVSSEI